MVVMVFGELNHFHWRGFKITHLQKYPGIIVSTIHCTKDDRARLIFQQKVLQQSVSKHFANSIIYLYPTIAAEIRNPFHGNKLPAHRKQIRISGMRMV